MEEKEFHCGHKTKNDLDMFCPECNRLYINSYIPFLFLISLTVFIYFYEGLIETLIFPILNSFLILLLIGIFLLFLLVSVLKYRIVEMLFCIFTIFPLFLIYLITKPVGNFPFVAQVDTILTLSLIIQFITFLFAVLYGLIDAPRYSKYRKLHKGSFWMLLAFIIGSILSLFELELKFLIKTIPETNFSDFLKQILNWTVVISDYRTYAVAIISGLVIVISIIKSLKTDLHIERVILFKGGVEKKYDFIIEHFFMNFLKLVSNIFSAILTVGIITLKVMKIIAIEIKTIVGGLIMRSLMLLLRLLRFAFIVFFAILFFYKAVYLSQNIDTLWHDIGLYGTSKTTWVDLVNNTFLIVFYTWCILMFSYRKWKLFEPEYFNLKRSFSLIFGPWSELNKSAASITVSTAQYFLYVCLILIGAWAVINSIFVIVNGESSSIGILFLSVLLLIPLLGIVHWLFFGRRS